MERPAWQAGRGCGKLNGLMLTGVNAYMQQTHIPATDAAIVGRLIKPDRRDFSPEAAREILSIQLSPEDQARARVLSHKAQKGALSPAEQGEMESYRRVGYWLGVLWSKARLSLKRAGMDAPHEHRT
jgi:hypothetical protein